VATDGKYHREEKFGTFSLLSEPLSTTISSSSSSSRARFLEDLVRCCRLVTFAPRYFEHGIEKLSLTSPLWIASFLISARRLLIPRAVIVAPAVAAEICQ
jgi:hypothetical protein